MGSFLFVCFFVLLAFRAGRRGCYRWESGQSLLLAGGRTTAAVAAAPLPLCALLLLLLLLFQRNGFGDPLRVGDAPIEGAVVAQTGILEGPGAAEFRELEGPAQRDNGPIVLPNLDAQNGAVVELLSVKVGLFEGGDATVIRGDVASCW